MDSADISCGYGRLNRPLGIPDKAELVFMTIRNVVGIPFISLIFFIVMSLVSWSFLITSSNVSVSLSADAVYSSWDFVKRLLGAGSNGTPALVSADSWYRSLSLGLKTLKMSVIAAGFASLLAFITFVPASRNISVEGSSNFLSAGAFYLLRATFTISRSVPELIWAMLIVFILTPGTLAGALALAIHNYGIIGRLAAEVVEDMDQRPIRALRSSGASPLQILFYCIIPEAMPRFLTYILYRWEVVIRTTVVVGFIAAGGLGRDLRLNMSWFHYGEVGVLLVTYILLVIMVDLISTVLRRLSR